MSLLFSNFDSCYIKVVKFCYSFLKFLKFKMLHVLLVLFNFNINFCMENADSALPNANGNANLIVVIICLFVLSISIINNKNSNNKPLDLDNINLVGNEEKFPKLILKNDALVPKNSINFIDSFNGGSGSISIQILVAVAFSLALGSSIYFTYQVLKDHKVFDKKK